ncbi:FAD-dependent oxidoreductase [Bauldia litoralis]|uniref:FAD-dependent oxidoreductase n=1 Tax=Bauldia litoralis TaxID=665467 RepID=UPI0032668BD7
MLTTDELAAFPVFSGLRPDQIGEVTKHAADIVVGSGQYVVHDGDEAAFYLVISGVLEVVQTIDGVEKKFGERRAGTMFGEIPLTFGMDFQWGAKALGPTRVLRLDARHYHALAGEAPEFAKTVRESAEYRVGGPKGMKSLVAERRPPQVTMAGHRYDATCVALRSFLARNQIHFEGVDVDEPGFMDRWQAPMPADADLPAFRLADGTILARPPARLLAERLGLQTVPVMMDYDTVVVGGGPAGLAAAVYGASEGLRTLVIEREAPGGQAGTSSRIENYLGFPNGISGDDLASRALRQAKRLGAEILITRHIEKIDADTRAIHLDCGDAVRTRTIVLATGVSWRRLSIEGFDRLTGKGIYYGAARSEASLMQGLDVHLIGAGNSAGQAAMFFANHARSVTLLVRGQSLEKSMSRYLIDQVREKSNIKVALGCEVGGVHGDNHLTDIDIVDRGRGSVRRETCGGLFVFIGADAETGWLPAGIVRNERGYVLTGPDLLRAGHWSLDRDPYLLETSVPGIFAAGDVRLGPVKRVASAVGEGSMAIAFIHQYLRDLSGAGAS